MKALTCEMCGSTNLIKDGGVFVCQSCGTKYTVEEAKKMMVEGTVDVKGTVKVDTSDELKNLYEIARRAKDSDNSENAVKYYDMILVKDPSSWEANFYVVYYKAMGCTIAGIANAGYSVINCLPSVIDLIDKNVPEEERENVLKEIQLRCSLLAHMLSNGALSHYEGLDYSIKYNYLGDFGDNINAATFIVLVFGDILEEKFNGKYSVLSTESWKDGFEVFQTYTDHIPSHLDKSGLQKIFDDYGEKIKKYDTSYTIPLFTKNQTENSSVTNATSSNPSSSGCYVATAVYGSYDCPEVWTLRRFRDFTLDETWYGRLFIKAYYATSPTFVKYFGNVKLFKSQGKKLLDRWVSNLNTKGYESTPYKDKY